MRYTIRSIFASAAMLLGAAPVASAQWVRESEQFYLQARHNWVFRDRYQAADRLFNAFDYGHAILYEKLWREPGAPVANLEEREFDFLTKRLLVSPPRLPLEEAAIEVEYVKLVPEAKLMFEWAHILHRQLYDVLADERLAPAERDAEAARVIAYYKTRRDLAFSSRPKSMALMQEQPYSLAFRQRYPKFNGLIWAYHWLQVGLYEPLLVARTPAERQALVRATVARFFQMVDRPVEGMPHQMPMTPAVAPRFTERYPEAAIIFDNLHSMHDVISDILANPQVPRNRKRAEILRAAALFRDDTSYVMPTEAWLAMSGHMGIENMGGPSVGFLPALPTPSVTYGAVMTHDDRTGAMTGFRYGGAVGNAHAGHAATPATDPARPAADAHAHHGATPASPAPATPARPDSALAPPGAHVHPAHGADRPPSTATAPGIPVAKEATSGRRVAAPPARRGRGNAGGARPLAKRAPRTAPPARASTLPTAKPKPAARPRAGGGPPPAARSVAKPTPKKPVAKPAPKPAPKKPVDPHAGHHPPPR